MCRWGGWRDQEVSLDLVLIVGVNGRSTHESEINHSSNEKSDKPGVIVERAERVNDQASESYDDSRGEGANGTPINSARIRVRAFGAIKSVKIEFAAPQNKIIRDHYSCDRSEERRVG